MSKYLIIGGLGFIGSNIAKELIKKEEVTILTNDTAGIFRLNKNKPKIIIGSILDINLLKEATKDQDFILNFAALLDPVLSKENKNLSFEIDVLGQKNVLEACKLVNKNAKIIFPSSRLVYGKPTELPIKETHQLKPISDYAKNKVLAENLCEEYNKKYNINSVILRMPQPYGPRQQVKHHVGISGYLIRKALQGDIITIFGDGSQLRDYPYIEDIVKAIIKICKSNKTNNKIYNLGSGTGFRFKDFVNLIIKITGTGKTENIPFPEEHLKYETGSIVLDITKIKNDIKWQPETTLEQGLKKTVDYYRKNLNLYL